jgi:hypothetical protein
MRRAIAFAVLLAIAPLPLLAQTAAQQALNAEPEVKKIEALDADLRRQQGLPNDDINKPSLAGMAVNSAASLRQMSDLLDSLEDRLNGETRECNFCAAKQDELSELIRQRMATQSMGANALGSRAGFMMSLVGMTPEAPRWTNIGLARSEASSALKEHCARFHGPQEEYCNRDGDTRLAGEHENAWAKCFNTHNWVEQSSERRAYETCMSATDAFTKLCERDRLASPPLTSCPYFTVAYSDVNHLHFYHDRWDTDPTRLGATSVVVSNQPAHVTLLEPVIVPVMPDSRSPGFRITVRGRLENALEGEYSSGLNPSTRAASVLNPTVGEGLAGRVELIPAGTEVSVMARLSAHSGDKANGGLLELSFDNNRPEEDHRGQLKLLPVNSLPIFRSIPWPAAGAVLLAANSSVSFATQTGCCYSMSVAEFRKRAAAHAASPATTLSSRVILPGSRMQTVLMEPITVKGIQSGKHFHAQLNVDMSQPYGSSPRTDALLSRRTDALVVPRGTDVYLKITDQGRNSAGLVIDYIVLNGQQVPVTTDAWPLQFGIPDPNPRAAPAVDVQPVGHTAWFDIMEQVEVSTAGVKPPNN